MLEYEYNAKDRSMKFLDSKKHVGNIDDWLSQKADERREKLVDQIQQWNTAELDIAELHEYAGLPVQNMLPTKKSALHSLEDLINFQGAPNIDILASSVGGYNNKKTDGSLTGSLERPVSAFREMARQAALNSGLLLENCEEALARVDLTLDSSVLEYFYPEEVVARAPVNGLAETDCTIKTNEKSDFKM